MSQILTLTFEVSPEVYAKVKRWKKKLEKTLGVNINLDPFDTKITLSSDDSAKLDLAGKVFEAINVGFDLKTATSLVNEGYIMAKLFVKDVLVERDKKKVLRRIMSRLIGTEGKAKKILESICNVKIKILDRKGIIYIIGKERDVSLAKTAISLIVSGSKHGRVWEILEREKRKEKIRKMLLQDLEYWGF